MEVGAVKQAFNNEVILLKKKLNQAKIHVIHKLTRKAKTLTEKKSPEHLKEKLKRKAESAVKEVLIIKKIKAKDIAKFIITHTGEVKDFLNRPKVDNDKACARLVMHKSLQDKYNFIRNRFGNVPIKDLFMSRQERRKLKKEAKEQQKNKNKKKGKEGKVVNIAGDWDVEDVEMGDDSKETDQDESTDEKSEHSVIEKNEESDNETDSEDQGDIEHGIEIDKNRIRLNQGSGHSDRVISDEEYGNGDNVGRDSDDSYHDSADEDTEVGKYIRLKPLNEIKNHKEKPKPTKSKNNVDLNQIEQKETDTFNLREKQKEATIKEKKQTDKKVKENKNKNLKEKLQSRKFKKDEDCIQTEGRKVVDPFFKTATGENYLSLAEPRQPDEVKEVHKQGNRQERRAAMFGHVAKFKPRRDNFRQNDFRSNKFDKEDGFDNNPSASGFRHNNDRFNKNADFNNRNANFNDRHTNFDGRNAKLNNRNGNLNDKNFKNNRNDEKKEEKLHPSWEAKRKLKASMTLKPSHVKKIVFEDD